MTSPSISELETLLDEDFSCRILESMPDTASEAAAMLAEVLGVPGHRVRPRIVFAASQVANPPGARDLLAIARAVEALHISSLIHDDVIDSAALRRGVPTARARWGNRRAAVIGAMLLVLSARQIFSRGPMAVMNYVATAKEMCMGGMSEVIEARDPGRSIRSYLQTATAKNGSLMALSGSLGAHAACADVESQVKIARFGRGMGIAWQIWDDVIDLTASESATGKSSSDLAGGIITLPVLFALDDDLELRQEFGTACAAGHDLEQFREAILATEGVPLALSLADEVAAAAEREAADVPGSDRLRNELDEVRARHSRLIQRVSSPSGSGIDIHDLLDGGRALSSDVAAASRPDVAVELAEVAARLFSGLSERPESLADATAVLNADRILAIALGLFDPRDAKSFDSHADRLIEIFNRELVALSPAGN